MKKILILIASLTLAFTLAACGRGGEANSAPLALPKETKPLTRSENAALDPTLRNSAKDFAARFTAEAVKGHRENVAVSPVSVYLALGLAAECTAGTTHEELMNALKIDDMSLKIGYSDFYRSIISEYTDDKGELSSRVDVTNSIWVDSHVSVKEERLSSLADNYFCYTYAAEFMDDNKSANEAVRDFVKTQTHGLIDQDFELDEKTAFVLINTLYLKEIWDACGNELSLTPRPYDFTQGDGTVKNCNLLHGLYAQGRVYKGDGFTHFYAETDHGYRLKFLVPTDGHTLEEVFTAENLALINDFTDYGGVDEENRTICETRCIFPAFEAEYDEDVKDILKKFGIEKLFSVEECDFSALTDEAIYCKKVQHVTKLEVGRRGIEGAAVTVMQAAPGGIPHDPYTYLHEDFVVDRAFGFVLTDRFGTVLFSGTVNEV